jgi:hypothetical protein
MFVARPVNFFLSVNELFIINTLEWTCAIVTVEKMREMRKENERNFHERDWI